MNPIRLVRITVRTRLVAVFEILNERVLTTSAIEFYWNTHLDDIEKLILHNLTLVTPIPLTSFTDIVDLIHINMNEIIAFLHKSYSFSHTKDSSDIYSKSLQTPRRIHFERISSRFAGIGNEIYILETFELVNGCCRLKRRSKIT